ncbi:hypothetical protein GDO81_022728 [Engystomops pustulosus]|uniref:Ig-like domain-containing protein n=1 Tax=Engystomops pustulosus TaxID=76066 RepID=A0AAV6ZQN5_ENGPU|nr:hypothetical protein GDO81_022728 [Engystomops pustulosus]
MGLILLGCGSTAGALSIHRLDYPMEESLGGNITLPCQFSGYKAPYLSLPKISVRWMKKTLEEEKSVYELNGGSIIQVRPGSYIPEDRVLRGDASLHIPNLQDTDEGEYTCHLIVTPEKATSKVTLLVIAQPTCRMSDSFLVMYPDTERSVTCYVDGFHPADVKIHWEKHSEVSYNGSDLDVNTCITAPLQTQDGTYNVRSLLYIKPMSTEEDGDIYSCVTIHRSLKDALTCNITLTVISTQGHNNMYLIMTIISGIISFLLIVFFAWVITLCLSDVSDIQKETGLIHMEENTLTCNISDFKLKDLTIKLFLETGTEDMTEVDSWSPEKHRETENDIEQTAALQDMSDAKGLRLEPVITSYLCLSKCVCKIHITPNIQVHHWAQLTLRVHHSTLKSSVYKHLLLRVESKVKVTPIRATEIKLNDEDWMELTCRMRSFYPKSIKVLWYKDKEEISAQHIKGTEEENGLYSAWSSVQCIVTEEDYGKIVKCKVKQRYTTKSITFILKKKAEPKLDPIQSNQESYEAGDSLELKFKIHSFNPHNIRVTWYKEDEEIPSQTNEPEDQEAEEFYVIGHMCHIVKEEDLGMIFTC